MKTAVAIALYHGERFVKEQLESLLQQTRKPDQVVLCDDGSKDQTVSIVKEFIREKGLEASWKLVENEHNLGYIKNFYKAVSLCDAELVFLCDQDDLWHPEKIEKMSRVMEENENVRLLSCRYGIVDGNGTQLHSILHPKKKESGALIPVPFREIAISYRWPGMTMCLRKSFFGEVYETLSKSCVIHDLALAAQASVRDGFYDYDYVGAYHRRHDNNAAKEEHRVLKLLNYDRKLRDLEDSLKIWRAFSDPAFGLTDQNLQLAQTRLSLMERRKQALLEKSVKQVISLYTKDHKNLLRFPSFCCDLILVLF